MDHIKFPKIPRLENLTCQVTEKLDGTNAVIWISDDLKEIKLGSRTRWLSEVDDNHGFYKWGSARLDAIRKLGSGYHYGEFVGPKIQRGYGHGRPILYLFNPNRYKELNKCLDITTVPIIADDISLPLACKLSRSEDLPLEGRCSMIDVTKRTKAEGLMIFCYELGKYIKIVWDKS